MGVLYALESIRTPALDKIMSVITLLGFRMAAKKPDPGHPFGHGRIEYLSGVAVSLIISGMITKI